MSPTDDYYTTSIIAFSWSGKHLYEKNDIIFNIEFLDSNTRLLSIQLRKREWSKRKKNENTKSQTKRKQK